MTTEEPEERTSVNDRWYWSPMLMIVVGIGVIGYQSTPILAGEAIALNWLMVAVGLGVAIAGLVSLKKAHAAHTAQAADGSASPRSDDDVV